MAGCKHEKIEKKSRIKGYFHVFHLHFQFGKDTAEGLEPVCCYFFHHQMLLEHYYILGLCELFS